VRPTSFREEVEDEEEGSEEEEEEEEDLEGDYSRGSRSEFLWSIFFYETFRTSPLIHACISFYISF
jgi:hypothetical protein